MELRILGSGTCSQSADRGSAGYILRLLGKTFLLDAGPGTLRQLAKMEIGLETIDEIFITHFHLDHVNDLPAILFTMKHCLPPGERGDLVIHGPEGFKENYDMLTKAYGNQIVDAEEEASVPEETEEVKKELSEKYHIEIKEHGGEEEHGLKIGSITVSTAQMEHSLPTIGYRFDDGRGKTLTYSGDTEPCNNIIKLAMESECLLMECSTPDDAPRRGHSTTHQAAAVAKKAKVKTLVLTHIYPENDTSDLEARASSFFDGIVIAARDGMRLTI